MIRPRHACAVAKKQILGCYFESVPIESALSVTRRVTARVTRWRDGEMRRRWCVAGLLRAEGKFRRVKGHRALPALVKVLEGSAQARPTGTERGVA
jgi:hypothetical protein